MFESGLEVAKKLNITTETLRYKIIKAIDLKTAYLISSTMAFISENSKFRSLKIESLLPEIVTIRYFSDYHPIRF